MIALEIIEYFRAEEMVNNNTPFEEQDYAEAITELEDLENRSCDSCIYVGKSNCINCLSCKRQYSDNWRNK